jgi:sensor histidine kinase YesM
MLWMLLRQSWKISIILLLCSLVMTVLISYGEDWPLRVVAMVALFTGGMWLALWLGNSFLTDIIDRMVSWTEQPVKRLIYGVIGMFVYTMSAVYFLVYFFRWVLNFDVGNDLRGMLNNTIIITTLITMFMTGRSFLLNWKKAAVDAEKMKKESVKAQYESLKNQVNPHFLFNSLNALTNLVYQDPDKAAKFIKQLSEVYRYVLDTRDKEVVPLAQEIDFVRSYLFLQQIRFGDKLQVALNLPAHEGKVAPLALQMLLENAIKHNIISEEQPLHIDLRQEDGYLVVANTLQRKKTMPEESNGLGLENIRRRYQFLSTRAVEVHENGERFEVRVPLIEA